MAPFLKVFFFNTAVLIGVLGNGPKVTMRISVGSLHKFRPLLASRRNIRHRFHDPRSKKMRLEVRTEIGA